MLWVEHGKDRPQRGSNQIRGGRRGSITVPKKDQTRLCAALVVTI